MKATVRLCQYVVSSLLALTTVSASEVNEVLTALNTARVQRNEAAVAAAFTSDAKLEVFEITENGPGTKTMTVAEFAKYSVGDWPKAKSRELTHKVLEEKSLPSGEVALKVETKQHVVHGGGQSGTATNTLNGTLVLTSGLKTAKIRSHTCTP